eukprot:PLAT12525.23.p1 GENE.PLAT12525.23~~PLAT12525.23.p1  ORF type:complete len:465 (+),score=175.04 PLAT12525.23:1729-3123(+)
MRKSRVAALERHMNRAEVDVDVRPDSLRVLLRKVMELLKNKVTTDHVDDEAMTERQGLRAFAIDWYHKRYGLARLAVEHLKSMQLALALHRDIPRVRLFERLLGREDEDTLAMTELNTYLDAFAWIMASTIGPQSPSLRLAAEPDDPHWRVWVPAVCAVECATVLLRSVLHKQHLAAGDEETRLEEEVASRKQALLQRLSPRMRSDAVLAGSDSIVHAYLAQRALHDRAGALQLAELLPYKLCLDDFQELLVEDEWLHSARAQHVFSTIFRAADCDRDGRLSEAELQQLLLFASADAGAAAGIAAEAVAACADGLAVTEAEFLPFARQQRLLGFHLTCRHRLQPPKDGADLLAVVGFLWVAERKRTGDAVRDGPPSSRAASQSRMELIDALLEENDADKAEVAWVALQQTCWHNRRLCSGSSTIAYVCLPAACPPAFSRSFSRDTQCIQCCKTAGQEVEGNCCA